MNMVSDMDKFTKFQTAEAIGQKGTAINEGMMMGMMMNQLQNQSNNQSNNQINNQNATDDITSKLQKLKTLFENGLIDETEFKTKKAELINKL